MSCDSSHSAGCGRPIPFEGANPCLEPTPNFETNPSSVPGSRTSVQKNRAIRCWLLRRLCCQNPFYLLSVCFVLHAVAHWYNADNGAMFSPWPLLWVITGYTLLLALTGFVVIRFGRVWDDARSILLIILLLFVELSLVFDETLVNDPQTGRKLLLLCWAFSAALSELLLRGLRIVLPSLPFAVPRLAGLLFLPVVACFDGGPITNGRRAMANLSVSDGGCDRCPGIGPRNSAAADDSQQ